jgi:hypothetical protein
MPNFSIDEEVMKKLVMIPVVGVLHNSFYDAIPRNWTSALLGNSQKIGGLGHCLDHFPAARRRSRKNSLSR